MSNDSNTTMPVVAVSTQFDYLLNALERASQADKPAEHGYAEKRGALFAYVRRLEALQREVDATYKQWCGRDYMHLPLSEAVGSVIGALQREVEELRAANERMAEWINGDCFCPCCGNTIACTDGCDFATDCPDAAQRMAEARAVLYGASKAEVPNG